MNKLRKLLLAFGLAAAVAGSALPAFADNPHAGNSGHFKGNAQPCDSGSNNPNCPPFGH